MTGRGWVRGVLAAAGLMMSAGAMAEQPCSYVAGNRLYVAESAQFPKEKQRLPMSELDATLGKLLPGAKHFVLFVHGRGDEPAKQDTKRAAVKPLEALGLKVLMFNWKACKPPTRPIEEAEAAAADLVALLEGLAKYKAAAGSAGAPTYTLLVHSMGNHALRRAIQTLPPSLQVAGAALFDNVLLTGSDAEAKEHPEWVSKITFARRIYVAVNDSDKILFFSQATDWGLRMGKGIKLKHGAPILASNAQYVMLNDLEVNHQYYVPKGQAYDKDKKTLDLGLCRFFFTTLSGQEFKWDKIPLAYKEPAKVYRLQPTRGTLAQCKADLVVDDEEDDGEN